MDRLELVVARYDEDLAWLRRVPREFRITVYDKGRLRSQISDFKSQIFPLPNVGHESHTYLHHIVTRYDDLAPLTVFCHGKPFDHVPDFHRVLRGLARGQQQVDGFLWLGFVIDRDDKTGSRLFQAWPRNADRRPLPLEAFWRALWETSAPDDFVFYPGGHFVLAADLVRRQPRPFYERALAIVAEMQDAGHCLERCWDRFFGVDGIPAGYRTADLPKYFRPIRRLGLTWSHVPRPPHHAPE